MLFPFPSPPSLYIFPLRHLHGNVERDLCPWRALWQSGVFWVRGVAATVACGAGQSIRRMERAVGAHNMPTQGAQGITGLASATITPFRTCLNAKGGLNRECCCHTMSNQYELPRAVGPQRHISSKVAVNTEMIAALKFTSVDRLETHTYGFTVFLSSASCYRTTTTRNLRSSCDWVPPFSYFI